MGSARGRWSWERAPTRPACIDPELGEAAVQALGRVPSATVEAHRRTCSACELERIAFTSLEQHAVEPSPFQGPLAVRLGYDTELLAAVCERLPRATMLPAGGPTA